MHHDFVHEVCMSSQRKIWLEINILQTANIAFADSLVECPDNEHWSLCGTMCEPSCEQPKPNPFFCPRIVCARDTAGCRCKNGYVRNEDNKDCVALKECPHKSQSKAI
nr:chymotrypsin inhibitor-like isoform X1 [Megalopta genalis]